MVSFAMTVLLAVVPVAKGTGEKMCVLTAADFGAAGVAAGKPTPNIDDGGNSVYCVYRGKSGAKGGVELDVFNPAGDSVAAVDGTWKTVFASNPAQYRHQRLAGADDSMYSLSIPQAGYPDFAANAVRRGDLIFTISIPSTPKAKAQLAKLSALVLQRLSR